jgi:1-acyl-sn-glycerol-3-phosphate acyltransferase
MIQARHHWFYVSFFRWYTKFIIHKDFKSVTVHGNYKDLNLPLLVISNHFSWWDGFFIYYLNSRCFGKKYHVMMLEEQLQDRLFLNKAGAFSIQKNSRSSIGSINYTAKLLENPGNMVLLFPQGEIQSKYWYPVVFEKGWFKILKKVKNPIQVVFVASLIDYFSNRKPLLNMYIHEYPHTNDFSFNHLYNTFNEHLINSIQKQKEI